MTDTTFQYLGSTVLLLAATTFVHGAGTLMIFRALFQSRNLARRHFGHIQNATRLTAVVVALLAVHVTDVFCWAAFYSYKGFFSQFSTSLYFSIATYTTPGYGDVLLRDKGWRLLGGVEALAGSLMLCWSTVILVPVVTRIYRTHIELWEEEEGLAPGRMHRTSHKR